MSRRGDILVTTVLLLSVAVFIVGGIGSIVSGDATTFMASAPVYLLLAAVYLEVYARRE